MKKKSKKEESVPWDGCIAADREWDSYLKFINNNMNKDTKLLAEAYDKVGNENLSDEELAGRDPRIVNDNEKAYYLIKSGAWSLEDFETYLYEIESSSVTRSKTSRTRHDYP